MKTRQLILSCGAAAVMLVLIFDSRIAMEGASEGIALCIRTLIPSLFPFLVVSACLTGALSGQVIPILRPVGRLCGIPRGAEFLLAVGLLGGYPVGAECVARSYRSGAVSKADAERLLGFCNNAGPSFLFGIVGCAFSDAKTAWILWGIQIAGAIAAGMVTAGNEPEHVSIRQSESLPFPKVLENALKAMALICGWVVLFRTVLSFLKRWIFWMLPSSVEIFLTGLLELSNGCVRLGEIPCEGLRFLVAGTILSLGGICVAMQTVSVTRGLSLRWYFPGKLLQCGVSAVLCCLLQPVFPETQRFEVAVPVICIVVLATLLLAVVIHRSKNRSSNPAVVGV